MQPCVGNGDVSLHFEAFFAHIEFHVEFGKIEQVIEGEVSDRGEERENCVGWEPMVLLLNTLAF